MKPTLAKFEEVADKCFGNITHIANAFNVNRKTVYEWIGNDKEFAEAIELGRDKIVDVAENAVVILAQGIPILDDKGKRVGWVTPPNPSSAHIFCMARRNLCADERSKGMHTAVLCCVRCGSSKNSS